MALKHEIVTADYQGFAVSFTDDGWFNATAASAKFGRRVDHYLVNAETKAYIAALEEDPNTPNSGYLMRTTRGNGGGTWFHPDLAVHFTRWLDVRFAIWCDRQIRAILSGNHPANDWRRQRHATASLNKVMNQILVETRLAEGKASAPHHFMAEAKVVNFAICGEFHGLDRNLMSLEELDLLAKLEVRNTVMLARRLPYAERKAALVACADEWRTEQPQLIGA